jgi:hypothetical protein
MTDGLVVLKGQDGKPYGKLETESGRFYTLDGKFSHKLERYGVRGEDDRDSYGEDGDALLSQFAANKDHEHRVSTLGGVGKLRTLKDAGGGTQTNMSADLGVGDVHIPSALTNFAGGYRLADGVADIAAPVVPVTKASDYYFIWDSANAFNRVLPNQGAPGAAPAEVNPTLSNSKFTTQSYALAACITMEVEANADAPLRPYQAAVVRIMNALRLEREIRVANLLTTSSHFNSNNVIALAGGAQWNNGPNSDPIANIHSICEKSALPVTRIIMGEPIYHAMIRNQAVRNYYFAKDGAPAAPSGMEISALFKLPPIIVAEMKYTTAGNLAYVWPSAAGSSSSVVFLHEPKQNPPTDQEDNATAYTFRWTTAPAPEGTVTGGFLVRSYYDQRRGPRGSRIVVLAHNDSEVVTGNILGGLVTGAIQ